jgi:hypothetical protein
MNFVVELSHGLHVVLRQASLPAQLFLGAINPPSQAFRFIAKLQLIRLCAGNQSESPQERNQEKSSSPFAHCGSHRHSSAPPNA